MSTPVLGPETAARNTKTKVDLKRVQQEHLERLKKLNPEVPKERTLMEKLVDQLRKSLGGSGTKTVKNAITTAEKKLETAKPKPKSKSKVTVSLPMPPKRITAEQKAAAQKMKADAAAFIKSEQMKNAQQYSADTTENYDTESMIKRKPASKKLSVSPKGKAKVFDYTKKYTGEADDDYDPDSMKKQRSTKKKRDRLFGLDFLPEIDSKEGGDKVNLPFGLGSYETLPQEEDYSKNKKGGSIKRQSGGRMRKAGCKRGMGKALRGY